MITDVISRPDTITRQGLRDAPAYRAKNVSVAELAILSVLLGVADFNATLDGFAPVLPPDEDPEEVFMTFPADLASAIMALTDHDEIAEAWVEAAELSDYVKPSDLASYLRGLQNFGQQNPGDWILCMAL